MSSASRSAGWYRVLSRDGRHAGSGIPVRAGDVRELQPDPFQGGRAVSGTPGIRIRRRAAARRIWFSAMSTVNSS